MRFTKNLYTGEKICVYTDEDIAIMHRQCTRDSLKCLAFTMMLRHDTHDYHAMLFFTQHGAIKR